MTSRSRSWRVRCDRCRWTFDAGSESDASHYSTAHRADHERTGIEAEINVYPLPAWRRLVDAPSTVIRSLLALRSRSGGLRYWSVRCGTCGVLEGPCDSEAEAQSVARLHVQERVAEGNEPCHPHVGPWTSLSRFLAYVKDQD